MKNKILFYNFFKKIDKKNKNYMMDQSYNSINYNINVIKNEILKNLGDKNEK